MNRFIFIFFGFLFDDVSDKYMMLVLLLLFVYVSFFFFVGILGNLMVIYVYLLKWRVNMFCVFILVFGLYDFINCVMLLIMEIVLFF